MGRLKTLVNLVILVLAAVIVWLEYQRAAERRAAAPGAGTGGGAHAQDPLTGAVDAMRNVASWAATAATEVTGFGPAQTESEAAEAEAAPPTEGGAPDPAGQQSAVAETTDTTLPANAVRGDGSSVCPDAYPVKGNASSMIYHVPGQPTYQRTVPEFCFATIEAAEAAGFRAPRQ